MCLLECYHCLDEPPVSMVEVDTLKMGAVDSSYCIFTYIYDSGGDLNDIYGVIVLC